MKLTIELYIEPALFDADANPDKTRWEAQYYRANGNIIGKGITIQAAIQDCLSRLTVELY